MNKRLLSAFIIYQGHPHEGYIYDRTPEVKKNNNQYVQALFTCRFCHRKFVERIIGGPLKVTHDKEHKCYITLFKYLCPYCDNLDDLYTTTPEKDAEDLDNVLDTGSPSWKF